MYTLAIDDIVEIPVKFTIRSKGTAKLFTPTLTIKRINPESDESRSEQSIKDFMHENVIGWKDQRLVLDASGNPADFSQDALSIFFSAPGVTILCWNAYIKEIGAKEKN
jgi:hypothetical protein